MHHTMLTVSALIGSGLLAIYSLIQFHWFLKLHRRYRQKTALIGPYMKSAVALTLRGADPFLKNCLRGLIEQDHPDYCVVIMIDSPEDPAAELVKGILHELPSDKVIIKYVHSPRMTCSLRMEALIQTVDQLDPSYQVVVLCDADTIPHRSWLRELVAPLINPEVGVASGIRWYMPTHNSWGTLVRHIWNFGAVVQMHAFDIGWGGSLAIRRSSLQEIGLIESWGQVMFEDTFTVSQHLDANWKLKTVPSATMINREMIDMKGCVTFVTRQLLNARMYHRNWKYVLGSALFVSLAMLLVFPSFLLGIIFGNLQAMAIAGAAIFIYLLTIGISLFGLERQIRRQIKSRGEVNTPVSWKIIPAAIVAQFFYFYCLVRALRVRSLEWRGLQYHIYGPRQVRLLEYKPYRSSAPVNATHSI